jgi:hypothetical protein
MMKKLGGTKNYSYERDGSVNAVTDDHSYYKSDRLPLLLPRIDYKIAFY